MSKPDVLVIGINGQRGVGKTTLIDRLCTELSDEFEVCVIPDLFSSIDKGRYREHDNSAPRSVVEQAAQVRGMEKIARKLRAIKSRRIAGTQRGVAGMHLLLVEGNGSTYEQWMSTGLISDLIHVVDLNQNILHDWPEDGFVKKAGLLVINKLDLHDMSTQKFASIALRAQATRGFNPSIFSSMHTGFGLDLVVVYIKQRIVMRGIKRKRAPHKT